MRQKSKIKWYKEKIQILFGFLFEMFNRSEHCAMYTNKTVERYSFRGYKGFSFDNSTSPHLLWIDLVGSN